MTSKNTSFEITQTEKSILVIFQTSINGQPRQFKSIQVRCRAWYGAKNRTKHR